MSLIQRDWFETEVRPKIVISVAHDFDFASAIPDNVLGSMWNSWQSQWSGVVEVDQVPAATLDQGNQNRFSRSIEVARNQGEAPTTLAIANMEELATVRVINRGVRPSLETTDCQFHGLDLIQDCIHSLIKQMRVT